VNYDPTPWTSYPWMPAYQFMRARKVLLVSLFSSFDELFGWIYHNCSNV